MGKSFARQFEAQRGADGVPACLHLLQHTGIVGRVSYYRDMRIVLRCRAHHRRAADIDVLDRLLQSAAGIGDGFAERVKVDHQQIDRLDAVRVHRVHVLMHIPPAEQCAVDLGVQRLDAPVHDFRKAGVIRHIRHRHTRRA